MPESRIKKTARNNLTPLKKRFTKFLWRLVPTIFFGKAIMLLRLCFNSFTKNILFGYFKPISIF